MLIIYKNIFLHYGTETDFKYFLQALADDNVLYKVQDTEITFSKNLKIVPQETELQQKHAVFTNKVLTVSLVISEKLQPYFEIEPKEFIPEKEQLFLEHLRQFIRVLRDRGFDEYVFYQNQGNYLTKLIPLSDFGSKIDINRKIIYTVLCFYGYAAFLDCVSFPKVCMKERNNSSKHWQSLRFQYTTTWENAKTLSDNMRNVIVAHLEQYGAIQRFNSKIEDMISPSISAISAAELAMQTKEGAELVVATPKAIVKEVKSCAFCQPHIIRNQLVLDFGKLLLLMNFRPYPGTKAHFLILPTRHLEDWSDLNEEENQILEQLVKALVVSIQAVCSVNVSMICTNIQNGVHAGQTVPHTHMHVIATPSFISFMIDIYSQLHGRIKPALTASEIAAQSNAFKVPLVQTLLSQTAWPRQQPISPFLQSQTMLVQYNAKKDHSTIRKNELLASKRAKLPRALVR